MVGREGVGFCDFPNFFGVFGCCILGETRNEARTGKIVL